jgi:hypothetical protein
LSFGPVRRLALLFTLSLCFAALAGAEVASAGLSKKAANRAAFKLAERVGRQGGAALWWAGLCKRRGTGFTCWAAVVAANGDGAAQRIRVKRKGGRTTAKRFGRIYYGNVSDEAQQHSSGGEWAVCGIHQSVCVGS